MKQKKQQQNTKQIFNISQEKRNKQKNTQENSLSYCWAQKQFQLSFCINRIFFGHLMLVSS